MGSNTSIGEHILTIIRTFAEGDYAVGMSVRTFRDNQPTFRCPLGMMIGSPWFFQQRCPYRVPGRIQTAHPKTEMITICLFQPTPLIFQGATTIGAMEIPSRQARPGSIQIHPILDMLESEILTDQRPVEVSTARVSAIERWVHTSSRGNPIQRPV
ncbi:hypothetical protein BMS3Bbin04_00308 [bacterium BMS3Bbin04]|nr:hypothetical protein BMS3Bbin04_00308 [bacterium BMS3Bbin04]